MEEDKMDPGYVEFIRNLVNPGTSNCPAYLNDAAILPASTISLHNGFGLSKAVALTASNTFSTTPESIGTREYVVIMYSSSATHQSDSSGFYIYQTDDLSLTNDFVSDIYNASSDAAEYSSV